MIEKTGVIGGLDLPEHTRRSIRLLVVILSLLTMLALKILYLMQGNDIVRFIVFPVLRLC